MMSREVAVSDNCNGAPLDRDELIFVFRLILDWAEKASCRFTNKQVQNVTLVMEMDGKPWSDLASLRRSTSHTAMTRRAL